MTKSLPDILKTQIEQDGPIDVGQYMSIVLSHPEHGYYMKQDPFGADGDFTTAPEISQMFGELLGAWAAHTWMQMGSPERFILLECGPGRGTLLADMMRATKGVEGFHAGCEIHLLEMSPALKAKQANTMKDYSPAWHEGLESVPEDVPMIVIGNEFLDALPVRQFERKDGQWFERMVIYEGDDFSFAFVPRPEAGAMLPESFSQEGVYEFSAASVNFIAGLCKRLKTSGGAALFIDYGHEQSGPGETLQALHKHEYVGVFEHIGDADLTAHVDFKVIRDVVEGEGLPVFGPVTQGDFLGLLGIEARAAYLESRADEAQKKDIKNALHRLTHEDEMGTLFRVIAFGESVNDGAG